MLLGWCALVITAAAPQVAVLSAAGEADFAELRFQPLPSQVLAPATARFAIVPRSTVLGVVVPNQNVVLATALVHPARDESWAFSLVRLAPNAPARVLVEGVAAASRPVVLSDGRVFVERGLAGPSPERDAQSTGWRVDSLFIDQVDPVTGATRSVLATHGFFAAPLAAWGHALVVYRSDLTGTWLELLDVDSGVRRGLGPVAATVHDAVVDPTAGALVYTVGDPVTHRWSVVRLDLRSAEKTELADGPNVALLPTIFPDGRVAVSAGPGAGLVWAGAALSGARRRAEKAWPAQGPGYERLRFFSGDLGVGLHEVPSDFPRVFARRLTSGEAVPVAAPPDCRLDLAGVLP